MTEITKEKRQQWAGRQRYLKKINKLSLSNQRKLESLPGWEWEIDLEKQSNEMCRKVCEFIVNNIKLPKKLNSWLSRKKLNGIFYESDQKIADDYGLFDLFEIKYKETKSNEVCHKVCQFIREKGRNPSEKSKNTVEKKMGNWLRNKIKGKQGINDNIFYNSDKLIADSYGLFDLFEVKIHIENREKESNEMCRKTCLFIKRHNRIPNCASSDKLEKSLGNWLREKKRAKEGKSNGSRFYKSDQIIANKMGRKYLFDFIDLEKKSNNTCRKVRQYKIDNGEYPKGSSNDREVRRMAGWISNEKRNKDKIYESNKKIIDSMGCYDLLFNPEEKSNDNCHKLCKFIMENNRNPSEHSENKEEKKLALWLRTKKGAKKMTNEVKFYKSDQAIVDSYGFFNLFG